MKKVKPTFPPMSVRCDELRPDLDAVAWDQGMTLSSLTRRVLGEAIELYAEANGGIEAIRERYRQALIVEAEQHLAGLKAIVGGSAIDGMSK